MKCYYHLLKVFRGNGSANITHVSVCFQLSQEAFPVLWVIIDPIVSGTVHVGQDPLAILGHQFVLLHFREPKARRNLLNIDDTST